jgi:hypothetical protein
VPDTILREAIARLKSLGHTDDEIRTMVDQELAPGDHETRNAWKGGDTLRADNL